MANSEGKGRFKTRRSRVLLEITVLVAVLYIVGGLAAFFIASRSFNHLAKSSTDKLIDEKAQTISSSYDYLAELEMQLLLDNFGLGNIDRNRLYAKLALEDPNDLDPLQTFLNQEVAKMRESELLGLQSIFMAVPNPMGGGLITFVSSDPGQLYMQFPDEIVSAVEGGESYLLMEDGLPALGVKGAQLITFSYIASPVSSDIKVAFIGVTPMQQDIDDINKFYDDEKKDTMINYSIISVISVVLIILLTYFVLRYLIRKRITEPIDILSGEAEEVMEGNLDIDIAVHKGGEFEGLETAFKKMVESFRVYIARSIGED
jgi:HAMP domain-containing protein